MIAPRSLFCERHLPAWRKLVMGSGAFHVVEICLNCGERTTPNYIPKKNVVECGLDPDLLPVFADHRSERPPCEVCGELGTEVHHWAPTHIFGDDAERWPKGWLCRLCHAEWHRRVTPAMSQGRPLEGAAD